MHLLQRVRSVQSPVAVEVSSVVSAMSPMKASTKAQDAKSKAQDAKSKAQDAKTKAQDAKPKGGKAMGILAIAEQLVAKAAPAQPGPPPKQTSSPQSPPEEWWKCTIQTGSSEAHRPHDEGCRAERGSAQLLCPTSAPHRAGLRTTASFCSLSG